jgi:transcriptional regulator with XRE-family HTH domain
MDPSDHRRGLVPMLLKQWRAQRGLSQMDLAIAADVSARHVSFIETGRSLPSVEMVLLLGATLGVPLRQINTMLIAAGHDPVFDETAGAIPAPVREAIDLLKSHHEPFPVIIVNHTYEVLDLNQGAMAVIAAILGFGPGQAIGGDELSAMGLNLARLSFDPAGAQPFIVNFDEVGRHLLWRIQRQALANPDDEGLGALLDDLLSMPTVAHDWRSVDLSVPSEPVLAIHLRNGDLDLRFLTTITTFQAPQNIAVEQLLIEHWFPFDHATAEACRHLAEH